MLERLIENVNSSQRVADEYLLSTARRQSRLVVFASTSSEVGNIYNYLFDLSKRLTPNGKEFSINVDNSILALVIEFGMPESSATPEFLKIWNQDPYSEEKVLIQYLLDNVKSIGVEKMKAVCGMHFNIKINDVSYHADGENSKDLFKALAYRLCFGGYVRNKKGIEKLFDIKVKEPDASSVIRYGIKREFESVSRAQIYKNLSVSNRSTLNTYLERMEKMYQEKEIDFLDSGCAPSKTKVFVERKVRSILDYNIEEVDVFQLSIDDTAFTIANKIPASRIADFFKHILRSSKEKE